MRHLLVRKSVYVVAWAIVVCLGGGGGGGGGSDAGPANFVNSLFISVTVCIPGSAICQTVDHVLVDTGSSGLRLMSSVLQSSLSLPQQTDGGGNPVAECAQFADGFTWGPLKLADVKISGEQADSVPLQVIGDPGYPDIPNDCANTGPSENTVASFGANGVLGVGVFKQDCGNSCLSDGNGFYYICPCQNNMQSSALDLDRQVQNPVAMFADDNNGVIIELPAISANGAASVTGALVFGIDTQTNNALGSAQVFKVKAGSGTFTTVYKNKAYNLSLIDSGSSVTFFADSGIPTCKNADVAAGFYCPNSTQDLSAVVQGTDGNSATLAFSVANAHNLFSNNPDYWAFSNLAAPDIFPSSFIWGLPAFMGRSVYTAIEGQNTSAGVGPYFAF